MTKNFINNKFTENLVSRTAAIAVLAGVGIATAPAQAGTLEWDNGTSDFFSDVNPVAGDTFSVTFSPDEIALISIASEEFVPPFTAAPPPVAIDTLTPAVGNFEFVTSLPPVDGIVEEFEYSLVDDLVFDYGNGVVVTFGEGSIFQGQFDVAVNGTPVVEGVEFEIIQTDNVTVDINGTIYTLDDPDFQVTGEQFTFGQAATTTLGGGYQGEVVVEEPSPIPEPASIFGLLAFGGLGIAMKLKK